MADDPGLFRGSLDILDILDILDVLKIADRLDAERRPVEKQDSSWDEDCPR